MIQRKQTVFLAVGALLAGLLYFVPLVRYARGTDVFVLRATGLADASGAAVPGVALKFPMHLLAGLLAALLVVVIVFFKDRPRQLRLLRFGYVFALGLQTTELFTHTSVRAYLALNSPVEHTFLPGFFLPLGVLLCCFLAERGIKADEELIKSMDRLR
jgi:hypothetical protein